MTPDLVCIAHRNGFFKKVNQAVIDKLGYTEAELMSSPISFFIHPEDKQFTAHRRTDLLKGKSLLNFQNRYVAKSGKYLANELHEELAQLASVLKTDIEWIKSKTSGLLPTVSSRIEHASVISQLLIKAIGRISFSISPNMLEHLGLNATLD